MTSRASPSVPEVCSGTDPRQAGLSGTAFAKVLRSVVSGEYPVFYWKQALILSDNRIPAFGTDTSVFSFVVPSAAGTATISVQLRFRRAFEDLLDVKGWDSPDIIMEEESLSLVTSEGYSIELLLLLK